MTGFVVTDTMPANVLKMGACCLMDGRIYRCIRRAAVITLADVETGATRDVAGIQDVARALPSGEPGLILGHVAGAVLTAGAAPAGVLVLVRTGWRWELARAEPSSFVYRGHRMRNFNAVTPWHRSPTRFRAQADTSCWLAVKVHDVPLKHVKPRAPAQNKPRPSRARPVSEHAPRKPPPPASQITWGRGKAKPVVEAPTEPARVTCHVPGCDRPPFRDGYICPRHWGRLPSRIRQKLCVLWRGGLGRGSEYAAVFAEGLRLLVEKESRLPAAPAATPAPTSEPVATVVPVAVVAKREAPKAPRLPWVERETAAPVAPMPLPDLPVWYTLKRMARAEGRQETLLFPTRESADLFRLRMGSEQPVLKLSARLETEPSHDGTLRAKLPPLRTPWKGRPPVKERKPYRDDDDDEDEE